MVKADFEAAVRLEGNYARHRIAMLPPCAAGTRLRREIPPFPRRTWFRHLQPLTIVELWLCLWSSPETGLP